LFLHNWGYKPKILVDRFFVKLRFWPTLRGVYLKIKSPFYDFKS